MPTPAPRLSRSKLFLNGDDTFTADFRRALAPAVDPAVGKIDDADDDDDDVGKFVANSAEFSSSAAAAGCREGRMTAGEGEILM